MDVPEMNDEAFTYDAVGNRKTEAGVDGEWNYNENNELQTFADFEYTYDDNGNMIQKKVGTVAVNYIYNTEDRLVRVEDDLTTVAIAEYYYDPFGRRLWKEVGGTRTYFFYADEGLVAEYDASGNELKTYGYKPDSTWTTDPLFMKQNSEYYFSQNDHLGTPQKLVAMNGAVVWAAQYSSFGKAEVDVETITNNLRFSGQYYDEETGLHYNFHRYYDPGVGRYLRIDPIGFEGLDENLYVYVWNDPVNWGDPYGLFSWWKPGDYIDWWGQAFDDFMMFMVPYWPGWVDSPWAECWGRCIEKWRFKWRLPGFLTRGGQFLTVGWIHKKHITQILTLFGKISPKAKMVGIKHIIAMMRIAKG